MVCLGKRSRKTLRETLDGRRLRGICLTLVIGTAVLCGESHALAVSVLTTTVPTTEAFDLTESPLGNRLAARATERLSALGATIEARGLRVLRDAEGYLIVPRATTVVTRANGSSGSFRTALVPVVRPTDRRTVIGQTSTASSPAWVLAGGACYERISDGWSWLDHCARVYQLVRDGDAQRDFYALERYGTAGANVPWVLKDAALGSSPVESSPPMSWQDWSPRSDRSGPCQPFTVRITSPVPGPSQIVDRCETWDITKSATGGAFTLEWSGCACIQDRELVYAVSISVPQGALPAWYVPAQVHGFAF